MVRSPSNASIERAVTGGLLPLVTAADVKRSANMNLSFAALALFGQLFLLKSAAFKEEREWRLVSYLVKVTPDTCLHRAAGAQIIPYRSSLLSG